MRPLSWQGQEDLISVEVYIKNDSIGFLPVTTHPLVACADRGIACCIHAPSDHHMKTWDQVWHEDYKVMDRRCEHGVTHPDPDHLAYVRSLAAGGQVGTVSATAPTFIFDTLHKCDGCCAPPAPEMMST